MNNTLIEVNFSLLGFFSFVRSVTMDKWKDIELEKMKAGGNLKFREFLESQEDYDPCWSLQEKYNSRAAALFRDKVKILKPIVLVSLELIANLGSSE